MKGRPRQATIRIPSKRERLVGALSRLGDKEEAEQQAVSISARFLDVVSMNANIYGRDIGRDDSGFYARPRKVTRGPRRALRDLVAAARKAVAGRIDDEGWITRWAAAPASIQQLWRPTLIQSKRGRTLDRHQLLGFSSPKLLMITPRAEDVLPALERELARIRELPGDRHRKPNEVEIAAVEAVRTAYHALTGHKGGRVVRAGKLSGSFVRLGREIDNIFGTQLFLIDDSVRLR
jgi:hypothetical protein